MGFYMPFPLAISAPTTSFLYQALRSLVETYSPVQFVKQVSTVPSAKKSLKLDEIEPLQPTLSNMVQVEMRPNVVLLHFDPYASIATLLDEVLPVVETLKEQIRPQARSLFHIRLCFASRILHPSFLRLVRTYIEQETNIKIRSIACSKESMRCILRAATGLDIHEAEAKSQVMHQTFRAGMSYSVEGDLLVYGDVHEGAQIQATGSITVMGVLSGKAHAGCTGDKKARIFASSMNEPKLWVNSHRLQAEQMEHKRGYSVASLSINKKISSTGGGL